MKNLYIVGAGGMGREMLNCVLDIHAAQGQKWNIKGFLDDTKSSMGDLACDYGIAGSILDYEPQVEDTLLMGIANPAAKKKLATMLKARGANFETIISPGAYLGRHNSFGEGNVFYGGFGMTVNVTIGNLCTLYSSGIGHDVRVGDYTTISSYCHIMGNVTIGEGVFIGGNVAVAPKVHIGDGAYICVGSVVMRDVPPRTKVMGNPAREIGMVDDWL